LTDINKYFIMTPITLTRSSGSCYNVQVRPFVTGNQEVNPKPESSGS
jgi:hypothetical protein